MIIHLFDLLYIIIPHNWSLSLQMIFYHFRKHGVEMNLLTVASALGLNYMLIFHLVIPLPILTVLLLLLDDSERSAFCF